MFLLDIFQAYYFYPRELCDKNIDHVNGISTSKLVALSIINVHDLLHFFSEMLFICVLTIPIKNIVNLLSDVLGD